LEALITQGDRKPSLIAITHVPTNSGAQTPPLETSLSL
jgi:hypothetical protein